MEITSGSRYFCNPGNQRIKQADAQDVLKTWINENIIIRNSEVSADDTVNVFCQVPKQQVPST